MVTGLTIVLYYCTRTLHITRTLQDSLNATQFPHPHYDPNQSPVILVDPIHISLIAGGITYLIKTHLVLG